MTNTEKFILLQGGKEKWEVKSKEILETLDLTIDDVRGRNKKIKLKDLLNYLGLGHNSINAHKKVRKFKAGTEEKERAKKEVLTEYLERYKMKRVYDILRGGHNERDKI